ncbi:MAG: hypothetical protein WA629_06905 [Candidatus Aquilonibacter sp.]
MRRALCIAPALLLAACGGSGGGPAALPQPRSSPAAKDVTVTAKISIPSAGSTSNRALKKIYDAASTTQGILLTVYPVSGTPAQAVTITGGDISSASSNCTATANGRTCTVAFAAPPGSSNQLLAQTYTQIIPASGTVPVGASVLGAGSTPISIVAASGLNSVSLTLNPVLASVNITPIPSSLRALLPATFGVSVVGLDASGSIIVAGQYVDSSGNPVSASLSLGSNPNNSLALSSTTVTVPGTTVTGTYNGNDDVAGNASASISITSAAPFSASGTLTMHGPTVTPMASAQPYLAGTPPPYANALFVNVNGSDPQIWYTAANSGTTCLANYDVASANGACATASPGPAGLSTDGSSYVYAAGATAPFYYQFNPLGFLTQINSCSTYCGSAGGSAYSPSGALYYLDTSNQAVVMMSPLSGGNGALASGGVGGTPEAVQVVTVEGTDSVAFLSSTGLYVESLGSGILATSPPSGMLDMYLANGGNDIYVTVPASNAIALFTYSSNLSVSQSYPTTQGAPQYLVGSSDGNSVWFSETTASGIGIGRIDLVNQRVNESQIATGGGIAGGIALNPNSDAIYILEWSGTASPGQIYQVTP